MRVCGCVTFIAEVLGCHAEAVYVCVYVLMCHLCGIRLLCRSSVCVRVCGGGSWYADRMPIHPGTCNVALVKAFQRSLSRSVDCTGLFCSDYTIHNYLSLHFPYGSRTIYLVAFVAILIPSPV